MIKSRVRYLLLTTCVSFSLLSCGNPNSFVTGNSGDNEVNVNVNIDGSFITELLNRINPSGSPSSSPTPDPSETPEPTPTPSNSSSPTPTPTITPIPEPTPTPTPTPSATPIPTPTPTASATLVSWWRANKNGKDKAGNHHLTMGGNIKYVSGKKDKAFQFDGNISHGIFNPFPDIPTDAITVMFWMKSSEKQKKGTPFSYATDNDQGNNEFLLYNNQNFEIYRGKNKKVKTFVTINDNQWHHIAVTWRGSDGQTILYKDGVLAFTGTLAAGTSIASGGSFVLGQEQDDVGGAFDSEQAYKGLMDEVKIYNQVLTQTEVIRLM